jgi:hypothetical protein
MYTVEYQSVNYCRTWHLHIFTCLCKMFNSSMIVWKVESWSSFSSAELRRRVTQKSRITSVWWGLYCDSINSTSCWKIFPLHLFYQWIYLHFSNLMQILYCNIGNPHSLGQQPVTFFREVGLYALDSSYVMNSCSTVAHLPLLLSGALFMWSSSSLGQKWDSCSIQVHKPLYLRQVQVNQCEMRKYSFLALCSRLLW